MFEIVDGRTDDRRQSDWYTISSLKLAKKACKNYPGCVLNSLTHSKKMDKVHDILYYNQ